MNDIAPIFIVGMGRAGTSLLMNAVNSTGAVRLMPESHLLDVWYPTIGEARPTGTARSRFIQAVVDHVHTSKLNLDRSWTAHVANPAGLRDILCAMMQCYAGSGRRPGDKTPAAFRYVATLLRWFPHGAHHLHGPRSSRLCIITTITERALGSRFSISPYADLESGSQRCVRGASHERVKVLRYENIAERSYSFVENLGAFLALGLSSAVERDLQPSVLKHGSLSPTDLGVCTARVEAWRDVLDPEDVALIDSLVAGTCPLSGMHKRKGLACPGSV